MTDPIRVYLYPADMYGCGHYRMIWPARVIEVLEPGVRIKVFEPGNDDPDLKAYCNARGEVIDAEGPADADVIVFQRPSNQQQVDSIPFLRARGIAVVVDIDDDLSHINPQNPAWAMLHPTPTLEKMPGYVRDQIAASAKNAAVSEQRMFDYWQRTKPRHSWLAVREASHRATLVTVSTPALVDRYGKGNGVVLPNFIPSRFLKVEHDDSPVIGWAGSTHSHPGDLKAAGGVIGELVRAGAEFRVVGDGTGADRDLGLATVDSSGPVSFADWPHAVSQIGVGIAPLGDTRFNEAKSWLKPLEYASVGVPWVASPRVEYRRLAELGAGFLADKRKDWLRHLRRLVADEGFRREQSEAVRAVAAQLTIEAHAWRYAEAWHRAVELQRAQSPRVAQEKPSGAAVGFDTADPVLSVP